MPTRTHVPVLHADYDYDHELRLRTRIRATMFRTALPENPLRIIALNRDVFFGIKLRNLAKELGYDLSLVPGAPQLAATLPENAATTVLIIIDMNVLHEGVDWDALAAALASYPDIPTLGFGSHTDVDERRSAKAIGLTRIVSNGDFHRNAAELIQRYARIDEI
jgi:hypothetical protein